MRNMKKYMIICAVLVALLAASCGKERVCRCVPKNGSASDRTMVYVDNGMTCSSITRLGFERQLEGRLVRTMEDVECEEFTEE